MPYQISITEVAETQLRSLPVRAQRIVEAAILARLQEQPITPTRAIKKLRPNPFAAFELRVGNLRVLYNVEDEEVVILVVGRKVGNQLIVEGTVFDAHQVSSPEQPGSESAGNAE